MGSAVPLTALGVALALGAAAPGDPSPDAGLRATIHEVADDIGRLRGKTFSAPPVAERTTPERLRELADARAARWVPEAVRGPRGRAWADLGLADEAALRELVRRLALGVEGMAAVDGRLFVAPGLLDPPEAAPVGAAETEQALLMMAGVGADEPVAVHHLVHLLSKDPSADAPPGGWRTDTLLAMRAWSEGEANLVALLHLFSGMGLATDVVERGIGPESVLAGRLVPAAPETSPAFVQRSIEIVFLEGFAETRNRLAGGGWDAVAEAAHRTTTAELLHAEVAALPRSEIAPPAPPVGGARLADTDSIGEHGVVVLVGKLTGKDSLALVAGDGWRDDRVWRWETATGSGATEWWSRWATAADAEDLAYAYRRGIGVLCGVEPASREDGGFTATCRGRTWVVSRNGVEVRVRVHPATWDPWLPSEKTR